MKTEKKGRVIEELGDKEKKREREGIGNKRKEGKKGSKERRKIR